MSALVAAGIIGAYKFWPEHKAKWDLRVDLISSGLGLLSYLTLTDIFDTRVSFLTRVHLKYEWGYYLAFSVLDPGQIGHHAMTLAVMYIAGPYKQFVSLVLFLFGLTTPFLDMYRATKDRHWIAPFATGFLTFRVVGGGLLTSKLLIGAPASMPSNIYWACSILLSSIWGLQLYWFKKIVQKISSY